ncbi:MAG: dihydropteroate synthase, partial [bacterium]
GGCCGTKPEHIAALVEAIDDWKPAPRPKRRPRFVSSPLQTVDLDEVPRPVIVGERTNAQGSKKAKKAVLADDIDALFSLSQEQVNNGASILDINLATSERADEADLMRRVVTRLTSGVAAPVMIDTTDPEVVAAALERIPGRAIINSINFEGGEDRARRTLELAKRYGSYVICLTIDESGMAIDVKAKRQIARRIAILAKSEFDIEADRLIFDPLTFTLASGDEKYRKAAMQTLEGLREIKKDLPESLTVLGISNCSYGLAASSR